MVLKLERFGYYNNTGDVKFIKKFLHAKVPWKEMANVKCLYQS